VELVHELGDNAEVAAAAADREEKIGVDGWRGGMGDAGCSNYCCLEGNEMNSDSEENTYFN
jgi:hypothetical protein